MTCKNQTPLRGRLPATRDAAPWRIRTGALAAVALLLAAGCLLAPATAPAATLVLAGPDGAIVKLDGRPVGNFPFRQPLTLPTGKYTVFCELKGYLPFEQTVQLAEEDSWLRVQVRLVPLKRSTAFWSSLLLAGLGQQYVGRPLLGWTLTTAEIGGLLVALYGEINFQNYQQDYQLALEKYQGAVTPEEIEKLRSLAADYYQQVQDAARLRDQGLKVAVTAVAVSVLDAWLRFPSVAAGGGYTPVPHSRLAPAEADQSRAFHVGWRLEF